VCAVRASFSPPFPVPMSQLGEDVHHDWNAKIADAINAVGVAYLRRTLTFQV